MRVASSPKARTVVSLEMIAKRLKLTVTCGGGIYSPTVHKAMTVSSSGNNLWTETINNFLIQ